MSGARRFQAVRARRIGEACRWVRVSAAANGRGEPRVGFAVPRGIGGAVVRNRIRRRLRAVVGERLAGLGGADVVVVVTAAAAAEVGFGSLRSSAGDCIDRAVARARAADAESSR